MASNDLWCHIRKETVNESIHKFTFFQSKFFVKMEIIIHINELIKIN